jgi:hypothetical protein
MRSLLSILAVALFLPACSGIKGSGPRPEVPQTVLEVDNRGFADMTIYVVQSTQRVRIGSAVGSTRTKLIIPSRLVSGSRELQFLADPIGSPRTSISDRIYVTPGDTVTLIIPPS